MSNIEDLILKSDFLIKEIKHVLNIYCIDVQKEFLERWDKWKKDLSQSELFEVVSGLMSRQITLAIELIDNPTIWNAHIAPLILRAMTDSYINFAWILKDPHERSKRFIYFGLGQEKLIIEHRKAHLKKTGKNPENDMMIKSYEDWGAGQRYPFLTEVNVGSWSEKSTRQMAIDAKCKDFYDLVYTPFSSATHNMWNHISKYNLIKCTNPLHKFHRIPIIESGYMEFSYVKNATKYVEKMFKKFDEIFKVKIKCKSSYETLINRIKFIERKMNKKKE